MRWSSGASAWPADLETAYGVCYVRPYQGWCGGAARNSTAAPGLLSRRRTMNEQSQDLKALLLQTNEEFHSLAAKHHELEDRLHQLIEKSHLSDHEQLEEVTLKKRKLQLKDRMEAIVRDYQQSH
jgi:uncharacterized protein YdcH (DUF465 family)